MGLNKVLLSNADKSRLNQLKGCQPAMCRTTWNTATTATATVSGVFWSWTFQKVFRDTHYMHNCTYRVKVHFEGCNRETVIFSSIFVKLAPAWHFSMFSASLQTEALRPSETGRCNLCIFSERSSHFFQPGSITAPSARFPNVKFCPFCSYKIPHF